MFRLLSDIILLPIILVLSYVLKFKLAVLSEFFFHERLFDVYTTAQIEPYTNSLLLFMCVWISTFYFVRLYELPKNIISGINEFVRVVKGVSIATIQMIILTFLFDSFPASRYVLIYTWVIGILIIGVSRFMINRLEIYALSRGFGSQKVVIIGRNTASQEIAEKILLYPSLGYTYAGHLCDRLPLKKQFHLRNRFIHLGKLKAFKAIIQDYQIEEVFICEDIDPELQADIIRFTEIKNKKCHVIMPNLDLISPAVFEKFDSLPFLTHVAQKSWRVGFVVKRLMDIGISLTVLTTFWPIYLLIAGWIKYVSPNGPILYIQERTGQHGISFQMLKFRTMIPDAEAKTGPVWVDEGKDTRYIRGGDFLRKFSLDELPQLWNVLKGDMTIVGPRPERPFFVEKICEDVPNFMRRHQMPVGITGWAQINGRSVLTRNPADKLRYDLYYINNWSILLDIKILLATISVVFRGEEAY